MSRMVSTQTKVTQLEGLLGRRDLNAREVSFVMHLVLLRGRGRLGDLSEKQLEWLEDLWGRHFA